MTASVKVADFSNVKDRSKFNRSGLFRLGVRADFDRIISD